jgi:ERCC4-type nuclease
VRIFTQTFFILFRGRCGLRRENLPGTGSVKARLLLKRFMSIRRLMAAEITEK